MSERQLFFRKALMLLIGCLLGFAALIPYLSRLQGDLLRSVAEERGIPLSQLLAAVVGQQAVVIAVTVFIGLWATGKVGISTPFFDALVRKESLRERVGVFWKPAIFWGVGLGAVVLGLSFVFTPYMPENFQDLQAEMKWWEGFLASFFGGFNEEVMMRLFLLSLVALLVKFLFARKAPVLPRWIFWFANVFAALAFGALHLGPVAGLIEITWVVVFYALLLNGILGLSFGWLFLKYGLASAMLAHFSTDIVLHVIPHLF